MGNHSSNPQNEGIACVTFFNSTNPDFVPFFPDPSDLSESERTEFNTQIVTEITSKSLVRSPIIRTFQTYY